MCNLLNFSKTNEIANDSIKDRIIKVRAYLPTQGNAKEREVSPNEI
jgi:hypothetical protein